MAEPASKKQKIADESQAPVTPISGYRNTDVHGTPVEFLLIKAVPDGGEDKWKSEIDLAKLDPPLDMWVQGSSDVFVLVHGWQGTWETVGEGDDQLDFFPFILEMMADGEEARGRRLPGVPPLATSRFVGIFWPSLMVKPEEAAQTTFAKVDAKVSEPAMAAIQTLATVPQDFTAAHASAIDTAIDGAAAANTDADASVTTAAWAAVTPAVGGGGFAARLAAFRAKTDTTDDDITSFMAAQMKQLRDLMTFWLMKNRAFEVGATAGLRVIEALAAACPDGSNRRINLFGHSFGAILASEAALAWAKRREEAVAAATAAAAAANAAAEMGGGGSGSGVAPAVLPPRLHSLAIMQGAFSCMAFSGRCTYHPYGIGILNNKKAVGRFFEVPASLSGPTIATVSSADTTLLAFPVALRLGDARPAEFADIDTGLALGAGSAVSYDVADGTGPGDVNWREGMGRRGFVNAELGAGPFVYELDVVAVTPGKPSSYDFGRAVPNGGASPLVPRSAVFTMRGDNKYLATAANTVDDEDSEAGKELAFVGGHNASTFSNVHIANVVFEAAETYRPGADAGAGAAIAAPAAAASSS